MSTTTRGVGARYHVDRGSKTEFSCGRHKWMTPYWLLKLNPTQPSMFMRNNGFSDVHTEGVRLRWTHVDGGGGPAPYESTDVILSSSHTKKLVSFLPEFCL